MKRFNIPSVTRVLFASPQNAIKVFDDRLRLRSFAEIKQDIRFDHGVHVMTRGFRNQLPKVVHPERMQPLPK